MEPKSQLSKSRLRATLQRVSRGVNRIPHRQPRIAALTTTMIIRELKHRSNV